MKREFPEYFPLTEEQLAEIWSSGFIVFDTNVILRLYRYKKATADDILSLWKKIKTRLWIPNQVAWEYNRNRLEKIKEAEKSYSASRGALAACVKDATRLLDDGVEYGFHPSVNLEDRVKKLIKFVEDESKIIEREYTEAPTTGHYARLHDQIGDMFEGNIGDEMSDSDLLRIFEDGKQRYEQKLGPGYADAEEKKKRQASEREIYGDLIIWRNTISKARHESRPAIIVTEDTKVDWWLKRDGKTIGPLPELRREFYRESEQIVHFYRLQQFLEHAGMRLNVPVKQTTVKDVERDAAISIAEANNEHAAERFNAARFSQKNRKYVTNSEIIQAEDRYFRNFEKFIGNKYDQTVGVSEKILDSIRSKLEFYRVKLDGEIRNMAELYPMLQMSKINPEVLQQRSFISKNIERYREEINDLEGLLALHEARNAVVSRVLENDERESSD